MKLIGMPTKSGGLGLNWTMHRVLAKDLVKFLTEYLGVKEEILGESKLLEIVSVSSYL